MKPKPLVPQKLISIESVEQRIFLIRGQKIILDADLAQLYGVTTKRLNEQVKRNRNRFPEDFMFRLSSEEGASILDSRSQIATLKRGQNLKYAPYAFTEHGAVMVANVLNSPRCGACQYPGCASYCQAPRHYGNSQRPGPKAGANGTEIRPKV
jgi:hypothetical protein